MTDKNCICRGNWRNIVKDNEHLLDRRFADRLGNIFYFTGIVHASDDYYYMMSRDGQSHLLSCVGSIETHGYRLLEDDNTNTI